MIAVIIYHSPCQKKFLPCYMIIFVALFVSPISNNPTDAQNMVSALVLSSLSCFFSWVYHFMGKKVRVEASDGVSRSNNDGHDIEVNDDNFDGENDLKNPRLEMRRFSLFTEKTGNPYNYSQVEGNDDMSGTELLSESEETGKALGEQESENEGGIENKGTSRSNNSSSSSNNRKGRGGGRGDQGRGVDEKSCRKKTFTEIASELRLTIIGLNPYT